MTNIKNLSGTDLLLARILGTIDESAIDRELDRRANLRQLTENVRIPQKVAFAA